MKAVIFDIDGVLLDSMSIWWDLGARYLRSMGVLPAADLSQTLHAMSMEQGAEYLRDHYLPFKTTEQILEDVEKIIDNYYAFEAPPRLGALQLLVQLKEQGIKMAAATSSPRSHVTKAFERLSILSFFDFLLTTTEVGESKHSSRIYDIAAAGLGCQPSEILVFEDSLYALKTAKQAGFLTCGVQEKSGEPDQQGMKETADIYIEELSSFMEQTKPLGLL